MTLSEILDALDAETIVLESGINAELTRESYATPFSAMMNYQRFIPILNYNIITSTIQTESGINNYFTKDDLFTADDWTVLNESS